MIGRQIAKQSLLGSTPIGKSAASKERLTIGKTRRPMDCPIHLRRAWAGQEPALPAPQNGSAGSVWPERLNVALRPAIRESLPEDPRDPDSGQPCVEAFQAARVKERLIAPMSVSAATVTMTAWLGLIGYGAWCALWGSPGLC